MTYISMAIDPHVMDCEYMDQIKAALAKFTSKWFQSTAREV